MLIKTEMILGGVTYNFQFDEKDEMDTMHKAIVLSNPPKKCNECSNTEGFKLDSNKDKEGNTYINVVCQKCYAKAKLGQYKSRGFFWHKFEKYVRPEGQPIPTPAKNSDW